MTIDPSLIGTPGDPSKFDTSGDYLNSVDGTWNEYQTNGKGGWVYLNTVSNGLSAWDQMNNCQSGASPGAGMAGFAKNESYQRPGESDTHYRFRGLWWAIKQFATLQPTPEESEAWAKTSGVVRDAAKGKGNFGLGSATRAEADVAGKAWVGDGYRVSGNGKAWVSQDGLRQYRPSSYKPNLGREQANLEQRNVNSGQWQSNGHIDVVP